MVNPFKRYQVNLVLEELYPSLYPLCSCGCGELLTGRKKRWIEPSHVHTPLHEYRIIKGDSQYIRKVLFDIQGGVCQCCGIVGEDWEADHIIPVHKGGGGCKINNYQTLCKDCHKEKTAKEKAPNSQGLILGSFPFQIRS